MELREPKRKKFAPQSAPQPETNQTIVGKFNGFAVVVEATRKALHFLNAGAYGKANLSNRSCHAVQERDLVRRRQFENREKFFGEKTKEKVIVMPDSDSECEDYFEREVKPEYRTDASGFTERPCLDPAEAYYLCKYEKCLEIYYEDKLLTTEECWRAFGSTDEYFLQNYICFHHFRRKRWIVKPAIKFGGDYLLYKEGPTFYHASYVVIIDVIDEETSERRKDLCRRSMDAKNIAGLNRVCETTSKELLIFQILWPKIEPTNDEIKNFKVKEVLMQRWDPNTKQLK